MKPTNETTGPWRLGKNSPKKIFSTPTEKAIGSACLFNGSGKHFRGAREKSRKEAMANARIFAASWELLKSLEDMIDLAKHGAKDDEEILRILHDAELAAAKARGTN